MTLIHKAGRSFAAAHNLATYPLRYRRLGRSWRDGWTALMLRLATTRAGRAIFGPKECSLSLKALPTPLTLRRTNSDIFVVRDVFESEDYGLVRGLGLPADATILDLGANIGLASLYFANLFPQSRVLAVEPDGENCDLIRRNCAPLIAGGRMDVVRGFVAAADGAATIDRSDQSWGFKKSGPAANGQESIPCLSVPTLLAGRGDFGTIDLLKCDIEGSEGELFADCAAWIGRVRNVIIEVHPPYSVDRLYEDLRRASWEFDVCDQQQRGTQFSLCVLRRKK
jgi:FkbM family methyltransferase